MKVAIALSLVLALMVVVPGFMILCWLFTKTMLVIGLVVVLTIFLLASESAEGAWQWLPGATIRA